MKKQIEPKKKLQLKKETICRLDSDPKYIRGGNPNEDDTKTIGESFGCPTALPTATKTQ